MPIDALELCALLIIAAPTWLWYASLPVRERALAATKAACRAEDLLLLDDTIAIVGIGLRRADDGRMRLCRVYGFEYSDSGDDRRAGRIVMLGGEVLVISLNLTNVAG